MICEDTLLILGLLFIEILQFLESIGIKHKISDTLNPLVLSIGIVYSTEVSRI